ncbi:hypothetical protein MLD38_021498 [Melastoma candidum]|uniref:Uncharacterized protein n=1 Tax=Melastoma candidum TaxID=119954 RepID=A0ACB9QG58_9MYRT|nr:hypothetical protein MLD38_021498 [Melastoma candidum]
MVRQREDLHVNVPTHFRCPISLDIMKSPVSLCTGITYDRSSIQRWLDSGHDTCPSTMQLLPSKDLVPNLTLHRLILLWFNSHSSPSPSSPSLALSSISHLERSPSDPHQLLSHILLFVLESDHNRHLLATEVGRLPDILFRFLSSPDMPLPTVELAIQILEAVLRDCRDDSVTSDLRWVHPVSTVLQRGLAKESKVAAMRIVEYSSNVVESKIAVSENEGLLREIIHPLHDRQADSSLLDACLSCLLNLSPHKRVKTKLVDLNLIETLTNLLSVSDLPAPLAEKALRLLQAVTSCREGRAALGGGESMGTVIQKLLKVSREATETAVRIVWAACWHFGEEGAKEAVARSNSLRKLLLVMQSDCSPNVRRMCSDLVKMLRKFEGGVGVCGGDPSNRWLSYDTKTTHIMPF